MTLAEAIEQTLRDQGFAISDDMVDLIEDFVESVEMQADEERATDEDE